MSTLIILLHKMAQDLVILLRLSKNRKVSQRQTHRAKMAAGLPV